MKEEFVTYDLAFKLKEKGFYYKCLATYDKDGMLGYNYVQPTNIRAIGFDDCLHSNNTEEDSGCIDAPAISQVLKWLRNQNIYVEIVVVDDSEEPLTYNIHVNNENVFHHHGEYFSLKDWTKCELAGIEYVIDNLI